MTRDGPVGAYAFRVEIDGRSASGLLDVRGLAAQSQAAALAQGGRASALHAPGALQWQPLVLTWSAGTCAVLEDWRDAYLRGPYAVANVRSGAIALLDDRGDLVRRYVFLRAWPLGWEGPSLDAGRSALAVEVLTIAHDGLEVVRP